MLLTPATCHSGQWERRRRSADADCSPRSSRHCGSNASFIHKVRLLTVFMLFYAAWQLHIGKEMKGKPPPLLIPLSLASWSGCFRMLSPMLPLSHLSYYRKSASTDQGARPQPYLPGDQWESETFCSWWSPAWTTWGSPLTHPEASHPSSSRTSDAEQPCSPQCGPAHRGQWGTTRLRLPLGDTGRPRHPHPACWAPLPGQRRGAWTQDTPLGGAQHHTRF